MTLFKLSLISISNDSNQKMDMILTDCDKEPIHLPSAIQPFGALLAIEGDVIVAVSENCQQFFGAREALLGRDYSEVLGSNCYKLLEAARGKIDSTTPMMVQLTHQKTWITAIAFRQDNLIIVECERLEEEYEPEIASLKFVREKQETILSYLAFVAEGVRKLTGYNRVIIYEFADDWHGEVIAESKSADLRSFYGHHFPATDIPEPARRLFTSNWVRMIADVDYAPVHIRSSDVKPIDLTLSALRSVSPIHLQYLQNMEVAASLTLSIICNGRLWGLIACHHLEPKYLPAHLRAVCALIAKMVSARVTAIEVEDSASARSKLFNFILSLKKQLAQGESLNDLVSSDKHDLWKLIASDGFDFIAKDFSTSTGHGLEPQQLKELLKHLSTSDQPVLHFTNLSNAFPQWSNPYSGGVLAISVNQNWFIWNKKELVRSITWAGHPDKTANSPNQLSPRTSFAAWQEQVKDTCSAWQPYEIELARELEKVVASTCSGKEMAFEPDRNEYLNRLNHAIDDDVNSLKEQIDFS